MVLMVGGLKSLFSLNMLCLMILILLLYLTTMEWEEVGRMRPKMFQCFSMKWIRKKLVLWGQFEGGGEGDYSSDGGS
ncbi:hypothetical protein AHAS_Ahas05G0023500 [Arachis hypogaea]